jgi:hypothetical protein
MLQQRFYLEVKSKLFLTSFNYIVLLFITEQYQTCKKKTNTKPTASGRETAG